MTEDLLERKTDTKNTTKKPPLFAVLLVNDDLISGEIVALLLMRHFGKSIEESIQIMMDAHTNQLSLVDIYPMEIAETKSEAAMSDARSVGFDLKFELQPQDLSDDDTPNFPGP
ncbi:ATP-dependent Clp protease adaptor ClpS [Roseibium sp. RKSG952]|uniref:ATP-dependent Clp protease adaptor ClpS n=1 Tax=Roseibium sp. RKSG952 TaxID=2529384 RepID=UPI0012BCBD8F|nr:ATP-dependent Clp protease adaptor ClpS [Roseibium sp. RKSG952]MTH95495.1 ATP-dependent Clp protease adaptor ClpS [Roseibium sp. RKSG952]